MMSGECDLCGEHCLECRCGKEQDICLKSFDPDVCSNCGVRDCGLRSATNPYEPSRNIWLCEPCQKVPFSQYSDYIKTKILRKTDAPIDTYKRYIIVNNSEISICAYCAENKFDLRPSGAIIHHLKEPHELDFFNSFVYSNEGEKEKRKFAEIGLSPGGMVGLFVI